ncbi:Na+/H+ antiporter [Spirosoma montaniterrae]|uniref:Sodium:proton antiporter n=1 Tax=Spirosoma montaniterrae TaxID=1178516 RepID=A0A1P9WVD9_9BACT|nr:Na+/H+ antiporter [Spirosoma montaniterrae]AQG79357.1 sodium:proton antiporter [Spirosoma montaniterrae]
MQQTLLLCLSLLLLISVLVMVGQRLRIPIPIFLVISGLLISFIPGIPRIEVDPELIFLIFLPPLLYEAAWFTSWKEFWRWRRIIVTLAFGLVFFTAFAVAYFSSWLIPGFTLALGFLLGGIISPPDAVAATSVLRGINVPKRLMSVIEGESLINDASSLIVFRFALAAVLSGTFVLHEAVTNFFMVTFGGIGIGLAVSAVFYAIHRWIPSPVRITILLTFILPYTLYLAAEYYHCSGVMAVVSGGLFMANQRTTILNHSSRLQSSSMWATVVFALNGAVFILIGLELPVIMRGLDGYSLTEVVGYAGLITLLVIIVRLVAALFTAGFTRVVGSILPKAVADTNPGWRAPIIVGWAGMRGVVSLASALSVPLTLTNGQPFPQRNLILFITFVVILITLVFQGLTLPMVVRKVRYRAPEEQLSEDEQESAIRLKLLEVALDHLNNHYGPDIRQNELVENLKSRMESDQRLTTQHLNSLDCDTHKINRYNHIITDVINAKRRALYHFRRKQEFDDDIIRKEEARLDLEEEKIDHPIH